MESNPFILVPVESILLYQGIDAGWASTPASGILSDAEKKRFNSSIDNTWGNLLLESERETLKRSYEQCIPHVHSTGQVEWRDWQPWVQQVLRIANDKADIDKAEAEYQELTRLDMKLDVNIAEVGSVSKTVMNPFSSSLSSIHVERELHRMEQFLREYKPENEETMLMMSIQFCQQPDTVQIMNQILTWPYVDLGAVPCGSRTAWAQMMAQRMTEVWEQGTKYTKLSDIILSDEDGYDLIREIVYQPLSKNWIRYDLDDIRVVDVRTTWLTAFGKPEHYLYGEEGLKGLSVPYELTRMDQMRRYGKLLWDQHRSTAHSTDPYLAAGFLQVLYYQGYDTFVMLDDMLKQVVTKVQLYMDQHPEEERDELDYMRNVVGRMGLFYEFWQRRLQEYYGIRTSSGNNDTFGFQVKGPGYAVLHTTTGGAIWVNPQKLPTDMYGGKKKHKGQQKGNQQKGKQEHDKHDKQGQTPEEREQQRRQKEEQGKRELAKKIRMASFRMPSEEDFQTIGRGSLNRSDAVTIFDKIWSGTVTYETETGVAPMALGGTYIPGEDKGITKCGLNLLYAATIYVREQKTIAETFVAMVSTALVRQKGIPLSVYQDIQQMQCPNEKNVQAWVKVTARKLIDAYYHSTISKILVFVRGQQNIGVNVQLEKFRAELHGSTTDVILRMMMSHFKRACNAWASDENTWIELLRKERSPYEERMRQIMKQLEAQNPDVYRSVTQSFVSAGPEYRTVTGQMELMKNVREPVERYIVTDAFWSSFVVTGNRKIVIPVTNQQLNATANASATFYLLDWAKYGEKFDWSSSLIPVHGKKSMDHWLLNAVWIIADKNVDIMIPANWTHGTKGRINHYMSTYFGKGAGIGRARLIWFNTLLNSSLYKQCFGETWMERTSQLKRSLMGRCEEEFGVEYGKCPVLVTREKIGMYLQKYRKEFESVDFVSGQYVVKVPSNKVVGKVTNIMQQPRS